MDRSRVLAAIVLLALPLLLQGVGSASAAPSPVSPDGSSDVLDDSRETTSIVDEAASVIGRLGRTAFQASYYNVAISSDRLAIDLYMNDTSTAENLLRQAEEELGLAADDIKVSVHEAPYTRTVLTEEAFAILDRAPALHEQGVEIYGVVIRSDGTGLTVESSSPERAAGIIRLRGTSELRAEDVTFESGPGPAIAASRFDDFPPYAGGAWLDKCTSGFGVRWSNGLAALVTAAHCNPIGASFYDGGGDLVGSVIDRDPYRDAATIFASPASGYYASDSEYYTYNGWDFNYTNQLVCQSGYTSNKVCSLVITNDAYAYPLTQGCCGVQNVLGVRAVPLNCSNCVAAGKGDSGGPVWTFGSQSRGIVSALQGDIVAYSPRTGGAQYPILLFTETGWILQHYSASFA